MLSVWTSVRPLSWSTTTCFSELERCGYGAVDCLVDKELFGWLQPEGSGQWLNVQVETGDKWCP